MFLPACALPACPLGSHAVLFRSPLAASWTGCYDCVAWEPCRYTRLLKEAFNPAGAGRGLFFSFDADVTLTQQRYAEKAA